MRKFVPLLLVLIAVGASGGAFAAAGEQKVTPPPALHIPYGGKIVTDISIGDADVLGVIKQVLPTLADAAKNAFSEAGGNVTPGTLLDMAQVDLKPLLASISEVKNVRVMIVKYSKNAVGAEILTQANAGVAKIGRFNRFAMPPGGKTGSMALYS